jgi:hypothetical protein
MAALAMAASHYETIPLSYKHVVNMSCAHVCHVQARPSVYKSKNAPFKLLSNITYDPFA